MAGSRESPAAYTATSSTLQLRTFLVDALSFREHALVEYARYQDPLGFNPVEQNMPPVFHAAQAGPHMIAGTTQLGVVGKLSATGFQIVDVTDGLVLPPGVQCAGGDVQQVGLGEAGQTVCSHRLPLFLGTLQCAPNPLEGISLGNSSGVAFINRGPQSGQLRLKLPLFSLQRSQGGADDLAGVFVPATLDLLQYEAFKIFCQIHIPSRHGSPLSVQSYDKVISVGKDCQ